METTEIAPEKTASEIGAALVKAGARDISLQYDAQRKVCGMRFSLPVESFVVTFALPVRVDPVFAILNGRRPKESWQRNNRQKFAGQDREQAERVAWRQLLRWMQAQLALIETGMVARHEVFMPYLLHAGTNQTLFEYMQGEGLKMLAAGTGR